MDELDELVRRALQEDIAGGDVTTLATVPADAMARARITQKAPGAIYGLLAAERAFEMLDDRVRCTRLTQEGVWREDGGPVLEVEGPARALLTGERTALNFLAHLSGVASMAARAAQAVQGTGARVLDTRKTTPGLRALEKGAVAAGGAVNHRAGLYDAILIKENHIAAAGGIAEAVARRARGRPRAGRHAGGRGAQRAGDRGGAAGGRAEDAAGQHGPRAAAGRGRRRSTAAPSSRRAAA